MELTQTFLEGTGITQQERDSIPSSLQDFKIDFARLPIVGQKNNTLLLININIPIAIVRSSSDLALATHDIFRYLEYTFKCLHPKTGTKNRYSITSTYILERSGTYFLWRGSMSTARTFHSLLDWTELTSPSQLKQNITKAMHPDNLINKLSLDLNAGGSGFHVRRIISCIVNLNISCESSVPILANNVTKKRFTHYFNTFE